MILDIKNINDFSDETLKNIIDTCSKEIKSRRTEAKIKKIKEICILLKDLHEIDPDGVCWYDYRSDVEYLWIEFLDEFADYHRIQLDENDYTPLDD